MRKWVREAKGLERTPGLISGRFALEGTRNLLGNFTLFLVMERNDGDTEREVRTSVRTSGAFCRER